MTDPENCGACGRSCLGGACNAGVCGPVTIHEGVKGSEIYDHLALHADDVYWGMNGAILKLPKSTRGEIASSTVPGSSNAFFIAVDDAGVYFTYYSPMGDILAIPHGNTSPSTLAKPEYNPVGLTLYKGKLYWANYGADSPIRTISTAGPPGSASDVIGGQKNPFRVAVDPSGVYWTYHGDGAVDAGGVNKAGAAASFASGLHAPSGIALDDTSIYVLERDGSLVTIEKAFPGQRSSVKNSSGEIFAGTVVVDGGYIYWTGPGTESCTGQKPCPCSLSCGNIYRKPKKGPPEVVAKGDWGNAVDLAVDGTSIYWTTGSDARLMRIAKPLP
jgi:hypothetical protein